MRKLILIVVVGLAIGALLGQLMMSVPGYWLVRVGDTSYQTTFWFGLVLLLAAFVVLHFLLRLIMRLSRPVSRFKGWSSRSRNRSAMRRTVRGLVALAEGAGSAPRRRWSSRRRFQHTLGQLPFRRSGGPLPGALRAGRYPAQASHLSTEGADTAVGMMQAQLMLDRQQYEEALAILTRLDRHLPNHPQVLKQLKQAYLSVSDWEGLRRLMPRLGAQQLISQEEREQLEQRAYRELIAQEARDAGDIEQVRTLWRICPITCAAMSI